MIDSTEAVLLWFGAFFALMGLWCGVEWFWLRYRRERRVRQWRQRLIAFDSRVERSKYALRSTVRP